MVVCIKGRLLKHLLLFFVLAAAPFFFTGELLAGAAPLPWADGERLTYEVHWGLLVAAEGTFEAHRKNEGWSLSLDLKSRGLVDMTVPIRSLFVSTVQPGSWHSVFFQADRHEGNETLKYECVLPEGRFAGEYRDLLEKKNRPIEMPPEPVQDLVSMLYNLRKQDWSTARELSFRVNDRWSMHRGIARLDHREKLEDPDGVERDCYVVKAEELNDKGQPRKNGWLKVWFTADEKRLPLQARLKFRYGTFFIRLQPGA